MEGSGNETRGGGGASGNEMFPHNVSRGCHRNIMEVLLSARSPSGVVNESKVGKILLGLFWVGGQAVFRHVKVSVVHGD